MFPSLHQNVIEPYTWTIFYEYNNQRLWVKIKCKKKSHNKKDILAKFFDGKLAFLIKKVVAFTLPDIQTIAYPIAS